MKATLCYVFFACVTLAWAGYTVQGLNAYLAGAGSAHHRHPELFQ